MVGGFAGLARLHARAQGIAAMPILSVPDRLWEQPEGWFHEVADHLADLVSRALTEPTTEEDSEERMDPAAEGLLLDLPSEEDFEALANDRGWGDGLPLRAPTDERVAAMLAGARSSASEVVVTVPPRQGRLTLGHLAANAVMAGCTPALLPLVCAAVRAACCPDFHLSSLLSTTSPATVLVVVSGPLTGPLGLNAGTRALGSGRRANATLGRAVRLVLQNAGGESGVTGNATLGQPGEYSFCLAENETESPWPPLATTQGIPSGQSAVTVIAAAGICEIRDSTSQNPADLLHTLAHSLTAAGLVGPSGNAMLDGQLTLVLCPQHARLLGARGHMSRSAVQEWLWEEARIPLSLLSSASRAALEVARSSRGLPPRFEWLPVTPASQDILLVVAGGAGAKSAYVPGWGSCRAVTEPVVAL